MAYRPELWPINSSSSSDQDEIISSDDGEIIDNLPAGYSGTQKNPMAGCQGFSFALMAADNREAAQGVPLEERTYCRHRFYPERNLWINPHYDSMAVFATGETPKAYSRERVFATATGCLLQLAARVKRLAPEGVTPFFGDIRARRDRRLHREVPELTGHLDTMEGFDQIEREDITRTMLADKLLDTLLHRMQEAPTYVDFQKLFPKFCERIIAIAAPPQMNLNLPRGDLAEGLERVYRDNAEEQCSQQHTQQTIFRQLRPLDGTRADYILLTQWLHFREDSPAVQSIARGDRERASDMLRMRAQAWVRKYDEHEQLEDRPSDPICVLGDWVSPQEHYCDMVQGLRHCENTRESVEHDHRWLPTPQVSAEASSDSEDLPDAATAAGQDWKPTWVKARRPAQRPEARPQSTFQVRRAPKGGRWPYRGG